MYSVIIEVYLAAGFEWVSSNVYFLFCLKHAGKILFVLLRNVCNLSLTFLKIHYVINITLSGL